MPVELLDVLLMLMQVTLLEPKSIDRGDDASQERSEVRYQELELLVEGTAKEIVVHVPDEVDEAFLLLTFQRVVGAVEIRALLGFGWEKILN